MSRTVLAADEYRPSPLTFAVTRTVVLALALATMAFGPSSPTARADDRPCGATGIVYVDG
jgi:hypothetical protein